MTQAEAARRIGVDQVTVSRWERGKVKGIKTENIVAISSTYGVPLSDVMNLLGVEARAPSHVVRERPKPPAYAPPEAEELQLMVRLIRDKTTAYRIRKGGHAPDFELRQLRRDLEHSVRDLLEATARDQETLRLAVLTGVAMLTGENDPIELPVAATKMTDAKRR